MKSLTLLAMLLCSNSFANLHQAPPNLELSRDSKGVFVDFISKKTLITYDVKSKVAIAKSTITFEQKISGKAIFDILVNPSVIKLNGQVVTSSQTSMNGISKVHYLNKASESGTNTLYVENKITKNIQWNSSYIKSAFWMSDLSDRSFIEQYLPSNLEYDQYKMDFEVKILNANDDHSLYTNGEVLEVSKNHWSVSYPDKFSASSLYFHLTKKGMIPELNRVYKSIDGREIPVKVYTHQSLSKFMNETLKVLAELEADYGPWPHDQVLIYGAGSGGMEYSGATITSFRALGHELIHSYFARAVMPAHGNAGWVDEAIASWRDAGYRSYSRRSLSRTQMAAHSVYRRSTDRNAYTKGMRFIGHLNSKFSQNESFKVFLKSFFDENKFRPFKTHEFKSAIEKFYNTSLDDEFDRYIYGKKGVSKDRDILMENPYHPHVSDEDLYKLL
jgi:hypothetical protein